ncbi:transcriptional regulator [Sulfitobacter sp. SK012]|uniref:helix-turn-helix transcriptional regulator n=1 Tax=Sulfitobacter sp. SK012 TaxID=1389005 RepID=UPI000E0B4689|nr:YafY family protein [Sulfitobacter sp. SK012]AXI48432.1 transcriptional regulator [Sulfitobacter sp. SK012]
MRSSRMFEIIQILRAAPSPRTAAQIAEALEVTKRTIYRDIASLQAMRVPIEGEAGVGYIMRPGYDLPPVNFDLEEAEALTVGLSMIARTGDKGLQQSAERAARKLAEAMAFSASVYTSSWPQNVPKGIDMSQVREAIRSERKLSLNYSDATGQQTRRTVLPVAVIYYYDSIVLAAWCEMRRDFRHFRPDRITELQILEEQFLGRGMALRQAWALEHAADLSG